MLKLYYTGSLTYNGNQSNPLKSLGGYKSASEVANGSLNQVFSSISYLAQRDGLFECRGLVLVNEGSLIPSLSAYFDYPDTGDYNSKLLIGVEALSTSFAIQKLVYAQSIPTGVTLSEADGVDNAIVLASAFATNGAIGIWLKREVFTPSPRDSVAATELEAYIESLKKQENVNLVFSY